MLNRAKKGDTLVEVALAVGIFSMVAVAVAAVLSSSTSGAQTALETTLARSEIDTQAEALRFVQTAYAISKNNTTDNKYYKLWEAITSKAVDLSTLNESQKQALLNYAPTSCNSLYKDGTVGRNQMFILNPRKLDSFTTDTVSDVYQNKEKNPSSLVAAQISPRLVYSGTTAATTAGTTNQQDAIIDDPTATDLYRAEGIYVIAVKDNQTTNIVDVTDGQVTANASAYYDFYIRTCWYGTDAEQPSTISTVIRLYDPNVIQGQGQVVVEYDHDDIAGISWPNQQGRKVTIKDNGSRLGWTFNWKDTNTGDTYKPGDTLVNEDPDTTKYYHLQPNWQHTEYTIEYNVSFPDGRSGYTVTQTCYQDEPCSIDPVELTASGYVFRNWCTTYSGANNGVCNGTAYSPGYAFPTNDENFPDAFTSANRTLKLYSNWGERNETISIKATWTSSNDYDTYISGKKSNGSSFQAYYGALAPSETVNGVTRILAQLDHDGQGSSNDIHDESFTINTLGGRDYYYYIRNYTNSGTIDNDITITVSGPYLGTKTYRSTSRTSCTYWNVFAYKNGDLVNRNTCTSSPETSY